MTDILIPVNKNVSPIYKYYSVFLSKVAENLSENNINVTLLLFSDLLVDNFKSHTLISGDGGSISNKSINELEDQYEFSFLFHVGNCLIFPVRKGFLIHL